MHVIINQLVKVYKDIASGLNTNRKGLVEPFFLIGKPIGFILKFRMQLNCNISLIESPLKKYLHIKPLKFVLVAVRKA